MRGPLFRTLNPRRSQHGVEQPGAALAGVVLLPALFGCGNSAPVRAQLLIEVDTNVPTLEQALDDEQLSVDASLDTLRIDVIRDDGTVIDFLDVVAPTPDDWPITFGALPSEDGRRVRFHMRLFRGKHATRGTLNGVPTLEPQPRLAVQRVVDLEFPESGVREARVALSGDCLGIAPQFGKVATSCIDAARPSAPAEQGIEPMARRTEVGSWSLARPVPCAGEAPAGAVCVPGGFSVLGDDALVGYADYVDAAPLVPILTQPFFVDRTEVTVGRYRDFVAANGEPTEPALSYVEGDQIRSFCGFRSHAVGDYDQLPLNCTAWDTFRAICQAAGGDLPTEAQWEHMARGRGQARTFPWGEEDVTCCRSSVSRAGVTGVALLCPTAAGIAPVGSHLTSESCGVGDQSRDGVLDLGGSVSEFTLDNARAYSQNCWSGPGILRDPQCVEAGGLVTERGGSFTKGPQNSTAALRVNGSKLHVSPGVGGRCVYPAGGG